MFGCATDTQLHTGQVPPADWGLTGKTGSDHSLAQAGAVPPLYPVRHPGQATVVKTGRPGCH